MEHLLDQYRQIQEKFKCGSLKIVPKDYPFFAFIVGYMYSKMPRLDPLYDLLESLHGNKLENKINDLYYTQLLQTLYEAPHLHKQVSTLMQKLDKNQPVNLFLEIEKINTNKQTPAKQKQLNLARPNRTISKDTVVMKQEEGEAPNDFHHSQTQSYDQQLAFKQLQQSEKLARQLQDQEQKMAKNRKIEDDAECQICLVGLYDDDFTLLDKCGHVFHTECLKESFKMQILSNKFPLLCPNDECKSDVLDFQIKQALPSDMYEKYQDHTLKSYADVNGDTVSWCPTADCNYLFFYDKDDNVEFSCEQCKKNYCLNCRVDWHKGMTCKEYKITNTVSSDDQKFLKFVKGKKFKQCPKCKFWVEKNLGCDHMTCKCKFEFCYKCGGVYMKCECVTKAQEHLRIRQQMLAQQRRKKLEKKQTASKGKSRGRPKKR